MSKCEKCKKNTTNKVFDKAVGFIYLCDECKSEFEQCSKCEEYFYREELKNGICKDCECDLV